MAANRVAVASHEATVAGLLVVDAERVLAESLASTMAARLASWRTRAATGAPEALHLIEQDAPDVALIGAEPGDGLAALLMHLSRVEPDVQTVVMSETTDLDELVSIVRAGARGWVSKSASVAEVARAVAAVREGHCWLPRSLLERSVRTLAVEAGVVTTTRLG